MNLNPLTHAFFEKRDEDGFALTFDDVLLRGGWPTFDPYATNLKTKLSRNVELMLPFAAAAMSAVVGREMAIECPKLGGIASIPRSFSIEEQSRIVGRVKHTIHGFIDAPITARPDETVEALQKRRLEEGWPFESFPVVEHTSGNFVGLVTSSDFNRNTNASALIGSIMTPRSRLKTAPAGISQKDAFELLRASSKNVLPVLNADKTLAGLYTLKDLRRILTETHVAHATDHLGRLRAMMAIGSGTEAITRARAGIEKDVDVIHIDMANAAQDFVLETVRELRRIYPDSCPDIIVGNFANPDNVHQFLESVRVDGILAGIGGGSICTTRVVTGVGIPQLTAVYDCVRIAQRYGIPVISDGGIRYSGDILKALCAGASSVMMGKLLASTDEAPGKKVRLKNGSWAKEYYGMGSERALAESSASRQRYVQGHGAFIPEGIEGTVPYFGSLARLIEISMGGLRKGFHYCGAPDIETLWRIAKFRQVTQAGLREAHPHDVYDIAESANYAG